MKSYYVRRIKEHTQQVTWRVYEQAPDVHEDSADWRASIWQGAAGYKLRLWTKNTKGNNVWATIATLPRETPFEEVKEAMFTCLRLGMDTGTS